MSFDDFWLHYPRKVCKKDARKAYDRAIKSVSHERIMEGLQTYLANKPAYADWCHAATWLNGERWEDEYDAKPKSTYDKLREFGENAGGFYSDGPSDNVISLPSRRER